ncbi:MAG: hypothetical protein A4E73_03597 [Syntrophaceae bacterium PtaU1.Bin231]|nr:Zn-ribbon domain-containing OB-fold protein [Chloroflexota bacterium]OPY87703.1 MAG: hypothetical protein A4E73_03597 [Syntrophaceae bacterium PtaU1.Bin231]
MAKEQIDDRFKRFGSVSFVSISRVNDFIDYLDSGKLMGNRCTQCGRSFFPPRADCFQCRTNAMEWFEVENTGELATFTTLTYAPAGFEKELPYTIAVLDYGDFKVFGRTDPAIPVEELRVGMRMKSVVTKTSEGRLTYVFQKA